MIAHLRGKLIFKEPGQAIVEAAGVGYDVTISVQTFTALPSVGAEASLHIHTQVSEDQIALFGFLDRMEKRLFERLITVGGVGPKLAIKILSGLSTERTVQAIRGQDHAQLTRIPGVGKKLAERLVVELKDKLDDFAVAPVQTSVRGAAVDDVLSALTNLGYQRPAAEKAIEQAVAKDAALAADFEEPMANLRVLQQAAKDANKALEEAKLAIKDDLRRAGIRKIGPKDKRWTLSWYSQAGQKSLDRAQIMEALGVDDLESYCKEGDPFDVLRVSFSD